jgi:hypothetical protein
LERAENLADFLRVALPEQAARFDFVQARPSRREFITEDWMRREGDLLFEIPYRWGEGQLAEVLVWVLLEHQSNTDPQVPLRTLFSTTMAWVSQWRAWAQSKPRGTLRLSPLIPIVLYTGDVAWGSHQTIHDLLEGPPELVGLTPNWGPIFWNLSARTAESLLAAGPMMQVLAAVRAGGGEAGEFAEVYRQGSANVAVLGGAEKVRWQELTHALLSVAYHERPEAERDGLIDVVRQVNGRKKKAVNAMAETIAEIIADTLPKLIAQECEQKAEQRGVAKGLRRGLTVILSEKFGKLPANVKRRIEAADVAALDKAIEEAPQLQKLEDLKL